MIIAHRLASVIDADRILVMNLGKGEEYDHPFKLLTNSDSDTHITKTGHFAKMVKATGGETEKMLFEIAKEKYLLSNK